MKHTLLIFVSVLWSSFALASHIVGGEMFYDYLGNDKYRITLKIFRDCDPSVTTKFDGTGTTPALITVYSKNNTEGELHHIGDPVIKKVPPAFNNPCIMAPNNVCVEEGTYTYTLVLPPIEGGYTIVYQRCCRNKTVSNLFLPEGQGSTYYTVIPGPEVAVENSSPRFNKFPPLYICNQVPFTFDHSATDPDGDVLVYSLCSAYKGLDACCAFVNQTAPQNGGFCVSPPSACPDLAAPPPYEPVAYTGSFSGSYPIASSSSFVINPNNGLLQGTPSVSDIYAVCICVQEYRNNQLINTHFRDFQFSVIQCTVSALAAVADPTSQCIGNTIPFQNKSINNSANPTYFWDFGVLGQANDTSHVFNPTYTYQDTGTYKITLIVNPGKPCTDTLRKDVYVYPPFDISYDVPPKQCISTNQYSFAVKGGIQASAQFNWDFGPNATPSKMDGRTPLGIHFSEDIAHPVVVYGKQFACRDTFADTIRLIGKPKARINNLPLSWCDPALVGFSNGTTSELPVNYRWIFSNGTTSEEAEPTVVFSPPGIYGAILIAESYGMCKDTGIASVLNITVTPKPTAGFYLSSTEVSIFEPFIEFKSYTAESALTNTFTFGDGEYSEDVSGEHTYQHPGYYRVMQVVSNLHHCLDTAFEVVRVMPENRFWIPNAFTPNDDSRNDFFVPVTYGVTNYVFEIYNRWGEKIFFTQDPLEGWNGKHDGKDCKQDVYTWRVSFKNGATQQTEVHLGHVTLIKTP